MVDLRVNWRVKPIEIHLLLENLLDEGIGITVQACLVRGVLSPCDWGTRTKALSSIVLESFGHFRTVPFGEIRVPHPLTRNRVPPKLTEFMTVSRLTVTHIKIASDI